jgi:hypothetical protein
MNIKEDTAELKKAITDRGDRKLRVIIKKGGKKSDNININKTPKRKSSNSILTDDDLSEYIYLNDSAYHTNRSFIQPPNNVSKLNLLNLGSAFSNNTTLRENIERVEKVHENEITILSRREKYNKVSTEFKVERIEESNEIKYKDKSSIANNTTIKSEFDIKNVLYFIGGALSFGTIAYLIGKKTK